MKESYVRVVINNTHSRLGWSVFSHMLATERQRLVVDRTACTKNIKIFNRHTMSTHTYLPVQCNFGTANPAT